MPVENEIKLAAPDLDALHRKLEQLGCRVTAPRSLERNDVLDNAAGERRFNGELLRIREWRGSGVLTFKGRDRGRRHKSREEIETEVAPDAARELFARLGYRTVFRYEKYRTELAPPAAPGHVTLDETPIGDFIELEGPPEWVDDMAARLGFSPADYITSSYASLFRKFSLQNHLSAADMVFGANGLRPDPK